MPPRSQAIPFIVPSMKNSSTTLLQKLPSAKSPRTKTAW